MITYILIPLHVNVTFNSLPRVNVGRIECCDGGVAVLEGGGAIGRSGGETRERGTSVPAAGIWKVVSFIRVRRAVDPACDWTHDGWKSAQPLVD
jgi:hypothetical protein